MDTAIGSPAAARLTGLLDRIDEHGAIAVAAELGQRDPELAFPYLFGRLQAYARDVLTELGA